MNYSNTRRTVGYQYRFNPPPHAHERVAAALFGQGYTVRAGVIGGRTTARAIRPAAAQLVGTQASRVTSKPETHKGAHCRSEKGGRNGC